MNITIYTPSNIRRSHSALPKQNVHFFCAREALSDMLQVAWLSLSSEASRLLDRNKFRQRLDAVTIVPELLLMDEILHHLGCIKPYE